MKLAVGLLFAASLLTAQEPGIIAGTVVESKTGNPVKKAVVSIQHEHEDGIGTSTDAGGKFTLRDVAPDAYVLTVERDGYVAAHDSERKVVTVNAGETDADLKLTMLKTGVISGRVLDVDGEPLAGANVSVSGVQKKKAGEAPGGYASTNDLGEYRAFNIPPGDYRISASYESRTGRPPVHMQAVSTPDGRLVHDTYQVTYYAGPVKIESGEELHGLDIQMVRTHAVRVRGRVIGSPGLAMVTLQSAEHTAGVEHSAVVRDEKGEFELPDVVPGKYTLTAGEMMFSGEQGLTASQTLDVGDTDINDVQITIRPRQKVAGSFIAPEGRKLPAGLIVVLASRSLGEKAAGGFAQVAADGTFTMKDVPVGDYDLLINATGSSDDLYVSAIRAGSGDVLADGVHISDSGPAPLIIVLKPNGGTAACTVVDDKGLPVPLAHVMLVPDAPKNRQLALWGDCKTDAKGACKVTGIAPGDYHLCAFPGDSNVYSRDPDVLKPYEANGKAISFSEGQQQTVQLTNAVE